MTSVSQIIRRRKSRQERKRRTQTRGRIGWGVAGVLVVLFGVLPAGVAFGGAAVVYSSATRDLPSPEQSVTLGPTVGPTQLYDRTGDTLLLASQGRDQRPWLKLKDLPPYVVQAVLRAEDPTFLSGSHFDPLGAFARIWQNTLEGPLAPDASITGRLVRNAIAPLPERPTIDDLNREIALVSEVNRRYTPEQILEWHLNTNYYGNDAYGIDAAAELYLGKAAKDLTLDEAALLAPVALAPQYNPFDDETAARGRQVDALRAMRAAGEITGAQFEGAAAASTPIRSNSDQPGQIAPEFTLYAKRQAESILDAQGREGAHLVARGGLKIVTTLDLDLYYQSECALRAQLARLKGDTDTPETMTGAACTSAAFLPPASALAPDDAPDSGTLAVIDVATGQIKSMVGPASLSAYQPGPTLFPFVYFTGFVSTIYNPARMVLDIPGTFPGAVEGLIYTPNNPDGRFRGPINLRDAMAAGLLPPAVQVARNQGLDNVLRFAHRIGINSLGDAYDLSLLERGGSVSALDIAYSYSVFASLGDMRGVPTQPVGVGYRQRDPVAVLRIEDTEGNTLWQYDDKQVALNQVPVFDHNLGYLISDILADQGKRLQVLGQGNTFQFPRKAAIVNGVTGDHTDSWTAGYTPQLAAAVRIGKRDGSPTKLDSFGLSDAAAVWSAVMRYAHERDNLPNADWQRPDDVVQVPVCQRSGLLANNVCPAYNELFLAVAQPADADNFWQSVEVNSQTGQLATVNTPRELRSQQVYFNPPPEAADWWRANNMPLPPTSLDTVSLPTGPNATQILQPAQFAYVGGAVQVRGTIDTTNMDYFQLSYGQGPNPAAWTQLGDRQTALTGNDLGSWDTTNLNGLYNLRLTVVRKDKRVEDRSIPVTVDNNPPTITLTTDQPGKVYRSPTDKTITLTADVKDDYAIDRVEFYHSGQLLGRDTSYPYGFEWTITRTGTEDFSAVAFDAAGNIASASLSVTVGRG
jgi:membrane peptidoglycan carboxypeptidase